VTAVSTVVAAMAVLALGAGASSALAVPWDKSGAIPPSRIRSGAAGPELTESYANDEPRGGPRLRFGVGPLPAGATAGTVRLVSEDVLRANAALERLRGRKAFAVRLNRLFMKDGDAGIRRYERLARRFARLGLDVELQVRYHPAPADDGNIARRLGFVRRVVRAFGPNRRVSGLQITNEVNVAASPNTSDGAYRHATEALVKGVIAAKQQSRRLGYRHQKIGFNYAWRFDFADSANDARFWAALGRTGGRRLRAHTDWVGLDLYPGTWVPGVLVPRHDVLLAVLAGRQVDRGGLHRRVPEKTRARQALLVS
jgi:hypothetical protein